MEGVRAAATIAALALAAPCAAEDAQWYLQIDNDVAFTTDRWYTSGLRIARTHRSEDGRRIEWGLAQEIYTPNLNRYQPDDRPYAARLFVSGARHDYAPDRHRTLEATLGVRGPSALGRQAQELVHRVVPAPEDDWSRQLPNRLDLQLIASQTQALAFCPRHACAAHFGAVVGTTQAFAHAGLELRAGGASQVASPMLRFAATPPIAGAHGWSAFAGASARAVARNTLLEGNADAGAPDIRIHRGVFRLAAGLALASRWGVVTFALTQDSREFDTQRAKQRFGTLAVHLAPF
jgi:hypothetical protein